MVAPREFTHIKVTKSTLDFIRFEGEVANKPVMEDIISRVDGKHMKLSGFQEPFKIKCGPSKSNYPTKNEWNNFFRDAVDMDEVKSPNKYYFQRNIISAIPKWDVRQPEVN